MADFECAQTLVAMRTNSISEVSKEVRLAAAILLTMKDCRVAESLAGRSPIPPTPTAAEVTRKPRHCKRQNTTTRSPDTKPPVALPSPPTTNPDRSPHSSVSSLSSFASSEPSRSGKRTRATTGPYSSGSPSRKRYKLGEQGGKTKSRGEQIGACMKAVFNQWETAVFDEALGEHVPHDASTLLAAGIYKDACALLPADGPGSLHHDEEIEMAAAAGFSEEKGNLADYYVRKYRTALGFIFLAEHNLRLRGAAAAAAAGASELKLNYIDFNKTQAQMFPRGDVNVTSRWFSKWRAWGWFPDMRVNKDVLNPELENKFPQDLRRRLIDEAIQYEDANSACKQWKHYPAIARL
ncbi:hypothetical protein DV738_g242, partial [Chaetothyriales sp. CBS 135597]